MTLFAIGLLFWPLLVIELLFLMFCIEDEHPIGSVVSMVIFGFLSYWLFDVNLLSLIINNLLFAPIVLAVYVVIGAIYGRIRWIGKLKSWRRKYDAAKTDKEREALGDTIPSVLKNRSRIIMWVCYWPISAMHWFLWDMFHEIGKMIYRKIRDMLLGDQRKYVQGTVHADKELD